MSLYLYRIAAVLVLLALIAGVLTFTHSALQPGITGSGSLWQTTALFLFLGATLAAFAGVMTAMFEQVERRNRLRKEREAAWRHERSLKKPIK